MGRNGTHGSGPQRPSAASPDHRDRRAPGAIAVLSRHFARGASRASNPRGGTANAPIRRGFRRSRAPAGTVVGTGCTATARRGLVGGGDRRRRQPPHELRTAAAAMEAKQPTGRQSGRQAAEWRSPRTVSRPDATGQRMSVRPGHSSPVPLGPQIGSRQLDRGRSSPPRTRPRRSGRRARRGRAGHASRRSASTAGARHAAVTTIACSTSAWIKWPGRVRRAARSRGGVARPPPSRRRPSSRRAAWLSRRV